MASGAIVLFVITLCFLVLSNFKFEAELFHLSILTFCLYCYATSMWALNYHYAIRQANSTMATLICLSVMYCHYKRFKDVTQLMKIFMWVGYLVVVYSYLFYGIGRVIDMGAEEGRLENTFNNINTLSMLAATVVVINAFFYFFRKATWSLLFLFPAVVFVLSTQSRKGLFVLFVGTLMLYILKYMKSKKSSIVPIFKLLGFVMLMVVIILVLTSMSRFENVTTRFMGMVSWITGEGEIDVSTQIRIDLKNLAWEQFKKTPFFGIGIGCSSFLTGEEMGQRLYMHDNYAELAVDGGLFGLIIYYSIFLYLLLKEWKYRKVDDMSNLIITLLVLQFFTDTGAVSYIARITYYQLMIFFLHLEICKVKYPQIK